MWSILLHLLAKRKVFCIFPLYPYAGTAAHNPVCKVLAASLANIWQLIDLFPWNYVQSDRAGTRVYLHWNCATVGKQQQEYKTQILILQHQKWVLEDMAHWTWFYCNTNEILHQKIAIGPEVCQQSDTLPETSLGLLQKACFTKPYLNGT